MNLYLEHNKRRKSWVIFDMTNHNNCEEPPSIIEISQSQMERIIIAYLYVSGIIQEWQLTPNR